MKKNQRQMKTIHTKKMSVISMSGGENKRLMNTILKSDYLYYA